MGSLYSRSFILSTVAGLFVFLGQANQCSAVAECMHVRLAEEFITNDSSPQKEEIKTSADKTDSCRHILQVWVISEKLNLTWGIKKKRWTGCIVRSMQTFYDFGVEIADFFTAITFVYVSMYICQCEWMHICWYIFYIYSFSHRWAEFLPSKKIYSVKRNLWKSTNFTIH